MSRFIIILGFCLLGGSMPLVAREADPTAKLKADRPAPKLLQQILDVCRMSPLTFDKAAGLLGSRLGPEREVTEYRSEWTIDSTDAIAEGTALGVRGRGLMFLSIVPRPSLDIAFEDLVPRLLDLPFDLEPVSVHADESLVREIDRFRYTFGVPAGELIIEVPANIPFGSPGHDVKVTHEAYETAKGRSAARHRVSAIHVSNERSRDWDSEPTLRQFRARFQKQLAK